MKIKIVPVPKVKMDKIPELELAFYVHIGHVRNELMIIEKFLAWAMNNPSGDVLSDLNVSQELIIIRVLAGKLLEGWDLVKRAYVSTDVSQSIETKLDSKTKMTLKELENYFSDKKNLINMVRNRFAFHYDPSLIRKQLSDVEETDQLSIYMAQKTVNCFYQFSGAIADSAMLNAVKKDDYTEALKKLSQEVITITRKFISFSDGCLNYMMESYLLPVVESEVRTVEFDVLHREQTTLPFFVE